MFVVDDALDRVDPERFDSVLLDLTLGDEEFLQILASLGEIVPETAAIILTDKADHTVAPRSAGGFFRIGRAFRIGQQNGSPQGDP